MIPFEWILVILLICVIVYSLCCGSKKNKKKIEGFKAAEQPQTIRIYNAFHLGDNVFSMIYFSRIKKYIEDKKINIEYYCKPEYHNQLKEFIPSSNIILKEYRENMDTSGMHNIWIGHREYKCNYYTRDKCDDKSVSNGFNDFLKAFYNDFSEKINFPNKKLENFAYTDDDLLTRYESLPDAYKNVDILIVNSDPLSGQFKTDDSAWVKKIEEFAKKWKVVITKKTTDKVKCTTDDKLTIKDIAAISTHTKIIIAVNTRIVPGFFNSYTLENIKRAYIFDSNEHYSYPKFENRKSITDITTEELSSIL